MVVEQTRHSFEQKIELQGLFMEYQLSSNTWPLVNIQERSVARMANSYPDSTFLRVTYHGEA